MSKNQFFVAALFLALLAFWIPFEHKYDKLFRNFSLTLIPDALSISKQYDKKIYFYISDLIALILTFIALLWIRIPMRKWFGNFMWVVWLCALFSILVSPFFHYPIPYFRLLQLFTPIALFSFLTNSKKDFTQIILYAIAFAALFQAGIAIIQYFNQAPIGLRLLGETNQKSFFYISDGSRWLFDNLFSKKTANPEIMRASGTFPHANVLGGFLVFSILASYYLAQKNRLWLYTLPLQFFALAISYSRSALFGWGLGTAIWLVLTFYQKGRKAILPIFIVIMLSLGVTAVLTFNQFVHRGGVVNYNSLAKHSDHIRIEQIKAGKKIVKNHLFFGIGWTQFSERSQQFFEQGTTQYIRETAPHNIFLFLACETGLISLGAFCLFLLTIFLKFLKAPLCQESCLFVSLFIAFLFIGCCDFYPILFQQGRLMFFLAASLLMYSSKAALRNKPIDTLEDPVRSV